jgi:hypothetical protein
MGSFRSRPLSTLLLLGLLSWIAYVLIAPEIDLDDFAIRKNDSPLAIQSLTQHVPQENASVSAPGIELPSTDAPALAQDFFFFDRVVEAPSVPPLILRC